MTSSRDMFLFSKSFFLMSSQHVKDYMYQFLSWLHYPVRIYGGGEGGGTMCPPGVSSDRKSPGWVGLKWRERRECEHFGQILPIFRLKTAFFIFQRLKTLNKGTSLDSLIFVQGVSNLARFDKNLKTRAIPIFKNRKYWWTSSYPPWLGKNFEIKIWN